MGGWLADYDFIWAELRPHEFLGRFQAEIV
jgi:hypothetical protein